MTTTNNEAVALVANRCPLCGTEESHAVPVDGYMRWKSGMLIQRALPDLNECIREFLITGFCADCRAENDAAAERAEREGDEDQ